MFHCLEIASGSTGGRHASILQQEESDCHCIMRASVRGVRYSLTEAVKADRRITPAGDWLLDNFYLIEEQIRTARRHLPKGYSRELPRLMSGPSAGLPRV